MSIQLDVNTLLASAGIVRMSFAVLFTIIGLVVSNAQHFRYWAASLWCALAGFFLSSVAGPDIDEKFVLRVAVDSLHGAGFALLWTGLRNFDGMPPVRSALAIAVVPGLVQAGGYVVGIPQHACLPVVFACFICGLSFSLVHVTRSHAVRPLVAQVCVGIAIAGQLTELLAAVLLIATGEQAVRDLLATDLAIVTFLSLSLFALDNEKSRSELTKMATTDPLTGLNNRRAVLDRLAQQNGPGVVLMLDIDRFKKINDSHGHSAGDLVLQEFARRLRGVFRRRDDITGRWGGEEFIAFAGHLTFREAMQRAEVLRQAIADEPFDIGGKRIVVTVSIGVAALSKVTGEDVRHGMELADMALYSAKQAGRNRTMAAAA